MCAGFDDFSVLEDYDSVCASYGCESVCDYDAGSSM